MRDDFTVVELSGRPVALRSALRRVARRRPSLFGDGRFDLGWYRLVSASHALVIAPPAFRAEAAERLDAAALDTPDITVVDASDRFSVLALIGPRAASLADSLAASGIRPAALLREAGRLALVVAATDEAPGLRRDLLSFGRPYGALSVSAEAVDLLCAAHAVLGCQRGMPPKPQQRSTA